MVLEARIGNADHLVVDIRHAGEARLGPDARGAVALVADLVRAGDESTAARVATAHLTAALDAAAVAFVTDGRVIAAGGVPVEALAEAPSVAVSGAPVLAIDRVGCCDALVLGVDVAPPTWVVVARRPGERFTPADREIAVAAADGLSVALRVLRHAEVDRYLVSSLQERLLLLERLRDAERTLTDRASVQDALDAVARGAAALLGDEVAWVRFVVDGPKEAQIVAAVHGSDPTLDIILTNGADAGTPDLEVLGFAGITASIEVPIREAGAPVGTLIVGSRRTGRTYTNAERDVLAALAGRAADALDAARRRHAMDEALTDAVHQALHDTLTGLPNRALLMDRLAHAVARSARQRGRLAVLFVDLDDFKDVNDNYGHAAGDAVLAEVGARLVATVRPADTAARLGGDEFVVVVEDVEDERDAVCTARRLLEVLAEPVTVNGEPLPVHASIGIAMRAEDQTPDDLIRMADLAMYAAKSAGKQRLTCFSPSMFWAAHRRDD